MAVLKDLIVHGNSRFLNGAKFNTINAESIGAEQGIFNKLIATTLDAKEATIDNLTAQNATVVGLLDVQGELHTNAWTNANIANIGGSFYISPTVEPTDGTTTISITRNSATSWTVSASGTFATDFIKSGTATSGVAWPANSLVLITGDVVVGDMVYPLGTLKGTLSAQVTATAASTSKTITITGVTDAQNNNAPSVLQELYELNNNANISNATFKKGKISLYKLGSNPIGILLSSMGTSSNSLIDIYGGVSTNPNVRIGHLAGLPNVNGSAPTGWGIYTDNGYFSGVIVSTSGKIGGFTIGSTDIHNGKTSRTETTNNGVWVGTDGIGLGKGITYFSNDGTGKIGPWTLSTTYLRNGNIASATNTSVAGVYLGTDGLNISNGTAATTSYITKTAVNIGNKLTWNGTTLTIDGSASIGGTTASTVVSNAADGAAAKTGLDNLEIGGRNLIPLSLNLKAFTVENASYATGTWTDTAVTVLNVQSGTYGIFYDFSIESNTTYTLSFNVESIVGTARTSGGFKKSDNTIIGSQIWNHSALDYAQVVAGRNIRTFTTPNESAIMRLYISVTNKDSQQVISKIKLEKGNKATDWSPAPEDLDVHKYVTDIDSNKGITIKPLTSTGNDYLQMDSTSIDFYRGIGTNSAAVSVMSLSDSVFRMGKSNAQRVEITASAVDMYDKNNKLTTRVNENGLTIYKAGTQVASYGTDATIGQVAANLYNVFIDADSGIALRKNTTSLLTINSSQIDINNSSGNVMTRVDSSGLTVFDGSGTADSNKFAIFGSSIQLGAVDANKYNILISPTGSIKIRQNTNTINLIDSYGMKIYLPGDQTYAIAQFGSTTTIGKSISSHVNIESTGVNIYQGLGRRYKIASFGESTIIGKENGSHFTLSSNGFSVYDNAPVEVLSIKPAGETITRQVTKDYYEESIGSYSTAKSINKVLTESFTSITNVALKFTSTYGTTYGTSVTRSFTPGTPVGISVYTNSSHDAYTTVNFTVTYDASTQTLTITSGSSSPTINVYLLIIQGSLDVDSPALYIGAEDTSLVKVDYHSLQMVDKERNSYFHISDLRDGNGYATVEEHFIANTTTTSFTVNFSVNSPSGYNPTLLVGTEPTSYQLSGNTFTIQTAPSTTVGVTITYKTRSSMVKAYTLGYRNQQEPIGGFSVGIGRNITASGTSSYSVGINTIASGYNSYAEGYETTASGYYSHAEGNGTIASAHGSHAEGVATSARDFSSHAEGNTTEARGTSSHAEGYETTANGNMSHAEGWGTTASGSTSHAEGLNTIASGIASHAQNEGTIAQRRCQTVIGSYNIADTKNSDGTYKGDYSFIIGNGTSDTARTNALTVDWNGALRAFDSIDAGKYTANTNQSKEYCVTCQGGAGKIYLYSHANASTGSVGIYSYNAAGNPKAILSVDQAQTITLAAPFISGTASANGHFNFKYTTTNIKANKNGLTPSGTSTPTTEMRHIGCYDKNNEWLGGFEFKSSEENTIGWRAIVHNWNSGASTPAWTGYKGIICDVARDGTTTWQVYPADTFRTAINAAPAAPTAQVTVANNDMIIIADASDSNKMTGGPKFDGSTATACLSKKGTWENFVPSSNVSTSGEYSKIPQITASGVLEGGRHLDFHYASATLDYAVRMSCGDPSGTNGDGSLTITANGGVTMSGALKVNNHSSAIGTVKDAYLSAAKKVPTGTSTGTPLCSISLEAGTWIITAGVRAPANNTGVRVANISTTSGDASLAVNQQAVQGANTQMRFVIATVATATTTYYLNAMQNSGSELNYPAGGAGWGNFLRAVRIA